METSSNAQNYFHGNVTCSEVTTNQIALFHVQFAGYTLRWRLRQNDAMELSISNELGKTDGMCPFSDREEAHYMVAGNKELQTSFLNFSKAESIGKRHWINVIAT